MSVTQLGEIQLSYSIGLVTYTRNDSIGWGQGYGNPYFVLQAAGQPITALNVNDPHITIWADWGTKTQGVLISTVEFTWNTSKHLEYRVNNRRVVGKNLNSGDAVTGAAIENLLIQFLVGAQIVDAANSVTRAFTQAQTVAVVQPQAFNLNDDFPSLGSMGGKKR